MRGQKRVEDARKRAYDPRIHLLTKKMDCRVKPGNDVGKQLFVTERPVALKHGEIS